MRHLSLTVLVACTVLLCYGKFIEIWLTKLVNGLTQTDFSYRIIQFDEYGIKVKRNVEERTILPCDISPSADFANIFVLYSVTFNQPLYIGSSLFSNYTVRTSTKYTNRFRHQLC